jgi:hypothetical protein
MPVHRKALELGDVGEGSPGLPAEGAEGFCAARFRDPDGNKLGVFAHG